MAVAAATALRAVFCPLHCPIGKSPSFGENDAVLTGMLGVAMIVLAGVAHRIGRRRLLDRWRTLEPRVWAETTRAAHRAWPFSWLILSRRIEEPMRQWSLSTPAWAADLAARHALRVMRLALLVMLAGWALIVFAVSSSGT
jgi:hypothetical protein